MNDFMTKYKALSPDIQKEVDDFMDFMISKYKGGKMFDARRWKSKIKDISVWTEEDIKVFEHIRQQFNDWKSEEW